MAISTVSFFAVLVVVAGVGGVVGFILGIDFERGSNP
jgi:hypothetical protein